MKTGNFSVDSKTATSFLTRMEADVTSPLLETKSLTQLMTTLLNVFWLGCLHFQLQVCKKYTNPSERESLGISVEREGVGGGINYMENALSVGEKGCFGFFFGVTMKSA